MELPAHTLELGIRRTRHTPVRYRQRRGRNLPESSYSGGQIDQMRPPHLPSPVSIALIDPKPLTRQSILEMLARSLPEHVALVGASSFAELIEMQESRELLEKAAKPHLVILYIRNVGVTNIWVQEQLKLIKIEERDIPVIMISDRDDSEDVVAALSYGVRGYIPTSIAAEVAIAALTLIDAGGTYIPVSALRSDGAEFHSDPAVDQQTSVTDELNLTSRELSVIDLLRQGQPNKRIALRLNMRESTVKVHVRNILKKLRVSNRTHAATVANRLLAQRTSDPQGLSVTADDMPGRPH